MMNTDILSEHTMYLNEVVRKIAWRDCRRRSFDSSENNFNALNLVEHQTDHDSRKFFFLHIFYFLTKCILSWAHSKLLVDVDS